MRLKLLFLFRLRASRVAARMEYHSECNFQCRVPCHLEDETRLKARRGWMEVFEPIRINAGHCGLECGVHMGCPSYIQNIVIVKHLENQRDETCLSIWSTVRQEWI